MPRQVRKLRHQKQEAREPQSWTDVTGEEPDLELADSELPRLRPVNCWIYLWWLGLVLQALCAAQILHLESVCSCFVVLSISPAVSAAVHWSGWCLSFVTWALNCILYPSKPKVHNCNHKQVYLYIYTISRGLHHSGDCGKAFCYNFCAMFLNTSVSTRGGMTTLAGFPSCFSCLLHPGSFAPSDCLWGLQQAGGSREILIKDPRHFLLTPFSSLHSTFSFLC